MILFGVAEGLVYSVVVSGLREPTAVFGLLIASIVFTALKITGEDRDNRIEDLTGCANERLGGSVSVFFPREIRDFLYFKVGKIHRYGHQLH